MFKVGVVKKPKKIMLSKLYVSNSILLRCVLFEYMNDWKCIGMQDYKYGNDLWDELIYA